VLAAALIIVAVAGSAFDWRLKGLVAGVGEVLV
jgi:hypothetical protein